MAVKKEFDAFISYRHADAEIVNKIYYWLKETAGFNIWYDQSNLIVGQNIASQLPKEIEKCRAVIVIISEASIESGWVEEEYNYAIGYQKENAGFKIIPLRIDNAKVPGFLSNKLYMEIPQGNISMLNALQFIESLSSVMYNSNFANMKDVYLSRSWKKEDSLVADLITNEIKKDKEYRFIGDSDDQDSFIELKGVNRVEIIVRSCGCLIAILPDRGEGKTSSYILKEIGFALGFKIPVIVVKEKATVYEKVGNEEVVTVDKDSLMQKQNLENLITTIYDTLKENYKTVKNPLYIFWASNFDDHNSSRAIKRLIEKTTAMPCIRGDEIREEQVQSAIIKKISDAFLVMADITGDNLNTCIECGIAMGSGSKLYILSGNKRETPKPFMLRNNQIFYYESEAEQIGIVYRLIRPNRRKVYNDEL